MSDGHPGSEALAGRHALGSARTWENRLRRREAEGAEDHSRPLHGSARRLHRRLATRRWLAPKALVDRPRGGGGMVRLPRPAGTPLEQGSPVGLGGIEPPTSASSVQTPAPTTCPSWSAGTQWLESLQLCQRGTCLRITSVRT